MAKPPIQTAAILLLLLLVVAAASWLQTADAASGTWRSHESLVTGF